MQAMRKFSLLGVISFVLLVFGAVGPKTALFAQDCTEDLVKGILPSITEFALLDIGNLDVQSIVDLSDTGTITIFTFPVPHINDLETQTLAGDTPTVVPGRDQDVFLVPVTVSLNQELRAENFEVKTLSDDPSNIGTVSNELRAFKGTSDVSPDLDPLSAIYVTDKFISGFLHTNTDNPAAPWFFIEPLRPLLIQNSPDDAEAINACFPASQKTHILYDTRATSFTIDLGPIVLDKSKLFPLVIEAQGIETDEIQESSQHQHGHRELTIDGNSADSNINTTMEQTTGALESIFTLREPASPLVVAVADKRFTDTYTEIEEKEWFEAQEEVLHLVVEFYREQVGITLQVMKQEGWVEGGPGETGGVDNETIFRYANGNEKDFHAFDLMCHFAQGRVQTASHTILNNRDFVPFRVLPDHDHNQTDFVETVSNNLPKPTLVHLFTGKNLGPVQISAREATQVSDSGCCFCEDSCGGDGRNRIVGLAEGVGGIWSFSNDSCFNPDGDTGNTQQAHHSITQQVPKPNSTNDNEDSNPDTNENYQATLFQKFLLVVHEFGHNLAARHSDDPTSIMTTPLFSNPNEPENPDDPEQNFIQFTIDGPEDSIRRSAQIIACLDNHELCQERRTTLTDIAVEQNEDQ